MYNVINYKLVIQLQKSWIFYFDKDNGQVVCYPWKVEVTGSNPVLSTITALKCFGCTAPFDGERLCSSHSRASVIDKRMVSLPPCEGDI